MAADGRGLWYKGSFTAAGKQNTYVYVCEMGVKVHYQKHYRPQNKPWSLSDVKRNEVTKDDFSGCEDELNNHLWESYPCCSFC